VQMFRSKRKTEYVTPEIFKDWSNSGHELENIGCRLDAVRETLDRLSKKDLPDDHWAINRWKTVESILTRKWQHTVKMKDVGLKQIKLAGRDSGPKIRYDWWEPSEEVAVTLPLFDAFYRLITERFGIQQGSLERAWQMAKQEQLEKARRGLA